QNVVTTGAITATAKTSSRSVRPLEIRLVNNAIIGPYPMNQAKKNTVQPPSQASSPRKVFNETNSLTYNPSASKKLLKINIDRKSTRLNSSHVSISYAVFCLKKKKKNTQ